MNTHLRILLLGLSVASSAFAAAADIFGVTTSGNLVKFDSAAPSSVSTLGAINFASGDKLVGLDFRSNGGALYALGYNAATKSGNVYTLDKANGSVLTTQALDVELHGSSFGVDWNPFADRLRIVSNSGQDLRVNLTGATPVTTIDGTLSYAAGDAYEYETPNVAAVGYTNSQLGPAGGSRPATKLYYVDTALDSLATTSNPNAGVLNTVGGLGLNATNLMDVDIYSQGTSNTLFMAINSLTGTTFHRVDLATGLASTGELVGGDRLALIAAQPVPEPATMVALGLGAAAMMRRRRKA